MKNEKVKKILKITGDVLLYVFLGICLVAVIVTISSRKNGEDAVSIFGMQMRLVETGSMAKNENFDASKYDIKDIPVNSMIFISEVPEDKEEAKKWYSELKVGDVLTFKYVYTRQETITHRIESIKTKDDGSGYLITLRGDNVDEGNSQVIDTSTHQDDVNYIIGKVTGQSFILGLILTVIKSPLGLIFIIIIPSIIIIALEVIKIVKMMTADKKAKEKEEKEAQQNELDMLKKRLAELEMQNAGPPASEDTKTEDTKTEAKDDITANGDGAENN